MSNHNPLWKHEWDEGKPAPTTPTNPSYEAWCAQMEAGRNARQTQVESKRNSAPAPVVRTQTAPVKKEDSGSRIPWGFILGFLFAAWLNGGDSGGSNFPPDLNNLS